jgi:6-phosphogluconolactonase
MIRTLVIGLALAMFAQVADAQPAGGKMRLYVGTYGKTIRLFEFDPATGKLVDAGVAAETPNPSFLAFHPTQPFMYAVSEIDDFKGMKSGAVAALSIDDKTGKLTVLNREPSGGQGPCHVSVDRTGKVVLVANYGSGSFESLPIVADGKLGKPATVIQDKGSSINPGNQQGPHAHSINVDAANKFAVGADLGTDYLYVFKLDPAAGTLTANDPVGTKMPPGSGPRHFAFHPDGKHAFNINEIAMTLASYKWDGAKGTLTPIETVSTLPAGTPPDKKYSTAEVVVHPSGKWVLGSNRTQDSIAVFSFDAAKEKLTHVGNYGDTVKVPRGFVLDPTGNFVLVGNQNGNSITVFRFNQQTGEMTRVGDPTPCPSPVCLRFRVK